MAIIEDLTGQPGPTPFVVAHPCGACEGNGCATCGGTGVARYYHGTKAALNVGDLLLPGQRPNFGDLERTTTWIYFTGTLDAATWGAELALGEGPGRIYIVEPTGPIEDDPNLTNKRFPGNPTKSFRSHDALRVIGEVVGWTGHSTEQLAAMKAGLERLQQQGLAKIEE